MSSSNSFVLVYGGTGQQGRAIVRTLHRSGRPVRVLTRSPSQARERVPDGVDLVEGDLSDPASLRAASADAGAVVLTVPLIFDREGMTRYAVNAVEAAEATGVPFLVYNASLIPPDDPGDVGVFHALHDATDRVLGADLDAVVLRPPLYLDNLLSPWTRPDLEAGRLSYPVQEDLLLPWISQRDLGRYVEAALDRRGPVGEVLDVAGPEQLALTDMADTLSLALDRPFTPNPLSIEAFADRIASALGPDAASALAGLYRAINAQPNAFFDRDFDRARTHLQPDLEPMAEWAQRVLAPTAAA